MIAFDYRGRGASAYDADWQNYTIVTEAGDIVAGLTALGIEPGRLHRHVARRPHHPRARRACGRRHLKAVVLNDIGPVIEGEGLAHIRSYLEDAPKPGELR